LLLSAVSPSDGWGSWSEVCIPTRERGNEEVRKCLKRVWACVKLGSLTSTLLRGNEEVRKCLKGVWACVKLGSLAPTLLRGSVYRGLVLLLSAVSPSDGWGSWSEVCIPTRERGNEEVRKYLKEFGLQSHSHAGARE
jgi:hypothetical protein